MSETFTEWLASSRAGERHCYFQSFHFRDEIRSLLDARSLSTSTRLQLPTEVQRQLEDAHLAQRTYDEGIVELTQQRVGSHFLYYATKRAHKATGAARKYFVPAPAEWKSVFQVSR